jgi:hypothetical protein
MNETTIEELLWTASFATVTGMLLFASWAATMLGAWAGTF